MRIMIAATVEGAKDALRPRHFGPQRLWTIVTPKNMERVLRGPVWHDHSVIRVAQPDCWAPRQIRDLCDLLDRCRVPLDVFDTIWLSAMDEMRHNDQEIPGG